MRGITPITGAAGKCPENTQQFPGRMLMLVMWDFATQTIHTIYVQTSNF